MRLGIKDIQTICTLNPHGPAGTLSEVVKYSF